MATVVITGGVRSGKSSAAQRLAVEREARTSCVCVATFARTDDDPELAERVSRHRVDRPAGFLTLEAVDSVEWFTRVPADALLLVDCIGTLLGRVMEECWPASSSTLADAAADVLPDGYSEQVSAAFDVIVRQICDRDGDTIVVTNEVGASVVPLWASARLFADLMGRGNRELVNRSDRAYLAVCGRLLDLSSLPDVVSWPDTQEGA